MDFVSLDRARVHDMPYFVYAGKGLKAVLTCPTDAEPHGDRVLWRKDGHDIDLIEVSCLSDECIHTICIYYTIHLNGCLCSQLFDRVPSR